MLQAAGVLAVYGNTEEYLFAPEHTPEDEHHRKNWAWLQPAVYWTRAQLSAGQMAWLRALPFEQRFSPSEYPGDDLLVVHANPRDVDMNIYPPVGAQRKFWGAVRQPDDDPELVEVLEGVSASVIAFGHVHTAFQRRWRHLNLVDVACCSLPGVDYDRRARYTLLSWRDGRWHVEQRWVDYDAEQEIFALRNGEMPSSGKFLRYFGV
jgi:hypothetical protein